MNWWQNRDIEKYSEVISKINNSDDKSINWVDKCRFLFEALNKTWNDFYLFNKTNNLLTADGLQNIWSDNKAIYKLMQSLEYKSKIANSTELKDLVNLSPQIMNHDTLRAEDYNPTNISKQLETKVQQEHRKFINAYNRLQEEKNSESLDALINKLAQLLYIVRSNIAHGEKTPKGPDNEKVERDKKVCETIYPLLYKIVEEIFDNPNARLVLYGTMRRGEVNHSLLQHIKGDFIIGKIDGIISTINGLPSFEWKTNTSINDVDVFISDELENHWNDLDRFEGDSYKRIWIPFKLSNGFSIGNVYEKNNQLKIFTPLLSYIHRFRIYNFFEAFNVSIPTIFPLSS